MSRGGGDYLSEGRPEIDLPGGGSGKFNYSKGSAYVRVYGLLSRYFAGSI